MYHLPGLWIFKTCNNKTHLPFSVFFTFSLPELWRKKKWNLQSSALDKLSAECCLLPRHYVPYYCTALFSSFYFIIFILVFDVKTKKRDQLRHKSLSEMSETVHWRLTLTWRLIFMITLEIYTWWRTSLWFARRSYTIPIYKVCFKFDIVNSSLFFAVERFFRSAVV